MKAITQDTYGSATVLEARDIDMPEIGDGQVLIRVEAAGVNPADWAIMSGLPYVARPVYGLRRPKAGVRGTDVSGTVEAVGSGVTRFKPGDEVFGSADGSYAEYAVASEETLAPKPANLSFEGAAAVPMAGQVALQALRGVEAGQQVLINGASGGIGTFAVQIAKALGAEVTAVASTRNLDMLRSIGADHVIDYTAEVFTRGDRRYDLILDNVSNHSLSDLRRVLAPDRHPRAERRKVRQALVRQWRPPHLRDGDVPLREPDPADVHPVDEAGGPARAQAAHRGRQRHAGHRSHLSAERNRSGDRPRR